VNWAAGNSGALTLLAGVAYGNGTFAAVGQFAFILTSPDGVNWVTRVPGHNYDLSGITYGNDTFVAVGPKFNYTSSDGVRWTRRTPKPMGFLTVTYGNGKFVGLGEGIFTSFDGVIWTARYPGPFSSLFGAAYGNGTFVVVGTDGTILQSGQEGTIALQLPEDGHLFDSCSSIGCLPTFSWSTDEAFNSFTILFSTSQTNFRTSIAKAHVTGTQNSWIPPIAIWEKIMASSYNNGSIRDIYWKIIGKGSNQAVAESEVRNFQVTGLQAFTIRAP